MLHRGSLVYKRLAMRLLNSPAAVQPIQFLLPDPSNTRPGAVVVHYPITIQFTIMFSKAFILFLVTLASVNTLVNGTIRQFTKPYPTIFMPS